MSNPKVKESEKKTVHSYDETDYEALFTAVKNYEERIKEIEDSLYWKIYLFFTKTKLILTSESYLRNDKWKFLQRVRFLFSGLGLFLIGKFFRQLFTLLFGKVNSLIGFGKGYEPINYETFKEKNFPRESDLELMRNNIKHFAIKPCFELFIWVDRDNFKHLDTFLNSLEKQIYSKFNVTFIAQNPSDIIHYTLKRIVEGDDRFELINFRDVLSEKPHSTQDYIFFTQLSCTLAPHCIYHFVNQINNTPETDFIYSDNDFYSKKDKETTENPYFKPDWSPHTLMSRNYIGDLFCVSKKHFEETELQSYTNTYSLILNLTHSASEITHIQEILYHQKQENVTSDKIKRNHQALNRFLTAKYRGYAKLSDTSLGCFRPVFKSKDEPLVTIIIPAKNKSTVLETCIDSLLQLSTYSNYEILVVDNGSTEKAFLSTLAKYEYNYPDKIRSIRINIPFNYSILNNRAAKYANGDYLLFLNNDTKLISPNLIEEMLKIAQLEKTGAVGPKLLYPNNTIQHAGIVLSLDQTGAHIYSCAHKDTSGYFNNTNCLTNYSAVTGACMMIAKEKFDLVGGFDEKLAVDCNDVELCCKLFAVGYFNAYIPWVTMYHYECLTRGNPMLSPGSIQHQNNEKSYFLDKWEEMITNDPFYNINLTRNSKNYELKHA